MTIRTADYVRSLVRDKAARALSLPGVLALEPGVRKQGGRAVADTPTVVVTVERKVSQSSLAPEEDLQTLFGAENVDVVEASPLKALFAQPAKYGIHEEMLSELETLLGYPFLPEAIGVPAPRSRSATRAARERRAELADRMRGNGTLQPLQGPLRLLCHASPDAGWRGLREFLRNAQQELVVGMYELTAPHVGDLLCQDVARRVQTFKLTLDSRLVIGGKGSMKEFDRTEAEHVQRFARCFGSGFDHSFASMRGGFHYHIKLAVRDRGSFWLSSGSWQSSNQPNLDPLGADRTNERLPKCNREWHVICDHAAASDALAEIIERDLRAAQSEAAPARFVIAAAGPMIFLDQPPKEFPYDTFVAPAEFFFTADRQHRVVPLLTPGDAYIEAVMTLVQQAQSQLLVQNQSLAFLKSEEDQDNNYTEFTRLLAAKSREIRDFRLLLRVFPFDNVEDRLDVYRAKGFDVDKIRFQPGCHNKGIIADGRTVLIGSHNFTNAGMTSNRDASLVVEHEDVAAYYQQLFEHDWRIADESAKLDDARPRPRVRIAIPGEAPPTGMTAYSFWELFDVD